MSKHILKDLPELVQAHVISEEVAGRISSYYRQKSAAAPNRLLLVFGVLGALLVGLGVILIVAHNWDNLSRPVKAGFAFLPLLLGQAACAYSLLKQKENITWREGSAVFLFLAVGASIALVSQVYHISGDLRSFMLSWLLVALPVIFVMRSAVASLLYLLGCLYFGGVNAAAFSRVNYEFWLLLLPAFAFYMYLNKTKPAGNFLLLHHCLVPLVLLFGLITQNKDAGQLLVVACAACFCFYYLFASSGFFNGQVWQHNPYKVIGQVGTVIILLMLSFSWFWEELVKEENFWQQYRFSSEMIASVVLTLLIGGLLFKRENTNLNLIEVLQPYLFFCIAIIFFAGFHFPEAAQVLINLLALIVGVLYLRQGIQTQQLLTLNFGLLLISALVICRFFDTNLTFVMRGLLFICVGLMFFLMNYRLIRNRKQTTL